MEESGDRGDRGAVLIMSDSVDIILLSLRGGQFRRALYRRSYPYPPATFRRHLPPHSVHSTRNLPRPLMIGPTHFCVVVNITGPALTRVAR